MTALFWGLSLKSRVFSPLDNSRPDLNKAVEGQQTRGFNDRTMPSWTPPGVTFPIMWVLIVGPLRAFSSTLVWEATGMHLLNPILLCLMLHLCEACSLLHGVEPCAPQPRSQVVARSCSA